MAHWITGYTLRRGKPTYNQYVRTSRSHQRLHMPFARRSKCHVSHNDLIRPNPVATKIDLSTIGRLHAYAL